MLLTSPASVEERRLDDITSQGRGEWFPDIRVKENSLAELISQARTEITSQGRGELMAYISNQGREEEAC